MEGGERGCKAQCGESPTYVPSYSMNSMHAPAAMYAAVFQSYYIIIICPLKLAKRVKSNIENPAMVTLLCAMHRLFFLGHNDVKKTLWIILLIQN